jgi:hypothetical protein
MESIHVLQAGINTHPRNQFVNLQTLEALETDIPPVYKSPPLRAVHDDHFQSFFFDTCFTFQILPFVRLFAFPPVCTQLNYTFFCGIIRLL